MENELKRYFNNDIPALAACCLQHLEHKLKGSHGSGEKAFSLKKDVSLLHPLGVWEAVFRCALKKIESLFATAGDSCSASDVAVAVSNVVCVWCDIVPDPGRTLQRRTLAYETLLGFLAASRSHNELLPEHLHVVLAVLDTVTESLCSTSSSSFVPVASRCAAMMHAVLLDLVERCKALAVRGGKPT